MIIIDVLLQAEYYHLIRVITYKIKKEHEEKRQQRRQQQIMQPQPKPQNTQPGTMHPHPKPLREFFQELINAMRSPNSTQKQQQVMTILKSTWLIQQNVNFQNT